MNFTTLCYIEKENQYLMLHRVSKKKDGNKDKWIGVGGHFEEGEVYELPFDHGFVCLGMRAQSKVYEEVSKAYKDTNVRVENIGDSVRARRIIDGTFEGRNIVFTLEQKGFL